MSRHYLAVLVNNLQTTWWEYFLEIIMLSRYSSESWRHYKTNLWTEK